MKRFCLFCRVDFDSDDEAIKQKVENALTKVAEEHGGEIQEVVMEKNVWGAPLITDSKHPDVSQRRACELPDLEELELYPEGLNNENTDGFCV